MVLSKTLLCKGCLKLRNKYWNYDKLVPHQTLPASCIESYVAYAFDFHAKLNVKISF